MQRGPYSNMGPAQSPPLHHPVPQHVSTVPQLRSPPPPMTQQQQQQQAQQQQYGYAPNNYGQPPFGGFINDPTAQMGFQMGKTAVAAGQEYMEQNFNRYVNVSAMKHYFNVSNKYVVNKLFIVLFPWRHRPWSRQQQPMATSGQSGPMFLPPREDINSPDMYIPVMAFVTYILLSTLLAGLQGAFRPELLGLTATNAFAVVIIELLLLKLGTYLLNISNESQWLDLVAYSGYKFVGIIITIALAALTTGGKGTGGYIGWSVFAYTYMANAFFLLRSLKYVILPDTASSAHNPIARSHKSRRTQFLFIYSYIIQLAFMWWLSSL